MGAGAAKIQVLESRHPPRASRIAALIARDGLRRWRFGRSLSGRDIWAIDHHIEVISDEVCALESIAKGKIPFEAVRRSIGLASRRSRLPCASPIEIGLHIVEETDVSL